MRIWAVAIAFPCAALFSWSLSLNAQTQSQNQAQSQPSGLSQTPNWPSSLKVGASALFLYRQSNFAKEDFTAADTETERNGLHIQEAEISFSSEVDPYSKLNLLLSIHPEYEHDESTRQTEQSWLIEPEELYAESLALPYTALRLGKFKAAFGKHNQLHTDTFPLVDPPVAHAVLLGDEGLNDVGGSAAVLLPVNWYSELIGQYLRGEGENAEFNSPSPSDGVGVGHWKNLWDLSDALTMEVGASFAHGKNALGGHTALYGSDLTFKWRPVIGGKYRSWILAGEYLRRELEQPGTAEETGDGWNVWGSYQFAERWSAAVRYDYLRVDGSSADEVLNPNGLENGTTRKYSAGVTFKPSEFSMFRIEYNQAEGPASAHGETVENKIYLQAGFVIGSHPPHTY